MKRFHLPSKSELTKDPFYKQFVSPDFYHMRYTCFVFILGWLYNSSQHIYWGQNKMTNILQTAANAFSLINFLNFHSNYYEVCSYGSSWQKVCVDLNNGYIQNRWQAITQNNIGPKSMIPHGITMPWWIYVIKWYESKHIFMFLNNMAVLSHG